MKSPTIGIVGQGFVGKSYSDDFERRGYKIVRYSLDEKYVKNKRQIASCDLVFIAVPTPTTEYGHDFSLVRESLSLVGQGKIVVIKSTLLPGTTNKLQEEFPYLYVVHSPEFLREVSAEYDARNPQRNIVGIPYDTNEYKDVANKVISMLPPAPFSKICSASEAELIKYAGNNFLHMKVVYINILYDLTQKLNCDWKEVSEALIADYRIGSSHMDPVHNGGRGAGGYCLIKDFAAFRFFCENLLQGEDLSLQVLRALEKKNISLLKGSGKDCAILKEIYGENF